MTQLNNVRTSVKFLSMLDELSLSAPIEFDNKKMSNVICRGKNRLIGGQLVPIPGSCNCKTAGVAGYCSKHINYANIDDLLSEIRTDFKSKSKTTKKRREIVKYTLYHRYTTQMTNLEKTALTETIGCMIDCGFEIDHGIISDKANISYRSPRQFIEDIKWTLSENYSLVENELGKSLVDLGIEPELSVAHSLLLNYDFWLENSPEIANKFQNFIDVLANQYDEDITTEINTRMFDITAERIVHSCIQEITRRNIRRLIQSRKQSLFKICPPCPPLENTNSQEECPICYESNNLGKLPLCSHNVCKNCWKDWWKTGHQTCPICRQTQN